MKEQMIERVSSQYMLATLYTTRYTGSRTDRGATDELVKSKNAVQGSARLIKNKFAGADKELKAIAAQMDVLRSRYYSMTLPWSMDTTARGGARLLKTDRFFEFTEEIAAQQQLVKEAVAKFEQVYDLRVAQAKASLGLLADVEYPTWDEVARQFKVAVTWGPINVARDFERIQLPTTEIEAMMAEANTAQTELMQGAMADAWQRCLDPLQRMQAQCSKEKGRIYDSLVTNLQEVAENLKYFNVTDDPNMETVRKEIFSKLCVHTPDQIRNSMTTRQELADEAEAILKKVRSVGYFGNGGTP